MVSSSTIQSFYQKEVPKPPRDHQNPSSGKHPEADGFTQAELDSARRPATQQWVPQGVYNRVTIDALQPGPRKVRFTGRIVNFTSAVNVAARSTLPQNYHTLVVKDNTGVVAIKLLSTGIEDTSIKLGGLVTVWAAFVADNSSAYSAVRVPHASLIIKVHPSQTSPSCIKFHEGVTNSKFTNHCALPLDYHPGASSSQMPGLMNLKVYLNSGHEGVPNPRILVCVSSIGPRKIIWSAKTNSDLHFIEVRVFDETADCMLRLWEDKIPSAKSWIPNHTILLITHPTLRQPDTRNSSPELGINSKSMVDVDPFFPDAEWLRKMAINRIKKESVYVPFPSGIWNDELAINGPNRTLFTVAEADECIRSDPDAIFTGKLNVVIIGVSITSHYNDKTLCCYQCPTPSCGLTVYANKPTATCRNCQATHHSLVLNPRIIGPLLDETSTLAAGKLIWSDRAWTELLFGSCSTPGEVSQPEAQTTNVEVDYFDNEEDDPFDGVSNENYSASSATTVVPEYQAWRELADLEYPALKEAEERLLYSRVTLTFGWSPAVERFCVLGVEW
ncbi:hypothetical protein QBC38DRAFT_531060 [Podospora fimiseda]|uniref:Uncharacterized protein n=1 Tax=Podospora fimiseda TaxID=252190 RepID=A0AAN7BL89_9PEZI|nr:hypothetical protein QBC38DRAFT_531060 [Podospora fimiseda]